VDFEVCKAVKKEWDPLSREHLVLQSTNNNILEMLEQTCDYLFNK